MRDGGVTEELAEHMLARRRHEQIVPLAQALQIGYAHGAHLEAPAPILEVGHQRRQIEAVVDGARAPLEVAAEDDRLGETEVVVVGVIAVLLDRPVVHAEAVLTVDGDGVVGHAVLQAPLGHLLGRLRGVDGDGNPRLRQLQAQVQAGYPGSDDADGCHSVSLLDPRERRPVVLPH